MANTVQIGIDLGTTNSVIAINTSAEVEVIRNLEGMDYTPSVFGTDKAKNYVVGKRAYEKLFRSSPEESKHYKAEVKRLMGTDDKFHFDRIDKDMNAEEVSAEILKSLKESTLRKHPDVNTYGAVITIPAYFSTSESEATKRAGNLAGFRHVVLLQEPIAAAIAHGVSNKKNENCLVYDFGGGTLDVALISSSDGVLSVRAHNGDNYLGGKDLDWAVVDKLLVPKLLEKYSFTDLSRSNEKYKELFSRLKYFGETAKKYLSESERVMVEIDGIGEDEAGEEVYMTVNIERADFESVIEPFVEKSIQLCKKTVEEAGIKADSISKVVLVGGTTQIPFISKRLNEVFKVKVDTSLDPFTVVAQGAAVYASGQQIPKDTTTKEDVSVNIEAKDIQINYESLSAEDEEFITGRVLGLKESEKHFIQIQSESGYYSSAKIQLSEDGKFRDTVSLEEGKPNQFWIYLLDEAGDSIPLKTDSFSITQGLSVEGAPIPHSIGLAVREKAISEGRIEEVEKFDVFFKRNSVLPLKATKTYKIVAPIKKGETENVLPVKVYEGESRIPARNDFICKINLNGEKVPFDITEKTAVEVTISVDESRVVTVSAYIPEVDQTFDARGTQYDENIDLSDLEKQLSEEGKRIKDIQNYCTESETENLEEHEQTIQKSIENGKIDNDEKRKANKRLKELQRYLDKLETKKQYKSLVATYEDRIALLDSFLEGIEGEDHKTIINEISEEAEKAIKEEDSIMLTNINEQLADIIGSLLAQTTYFWERHLEKIKMGGYVFSDASRAEELLNQGQAALEEKDVATLKECVVALYGLLPPEEKSKEIHDMSGISI